MQALCRLLQEGVRHLPVLPRHEEVRWAWTHEEELHHETVSSGESSYVWKQIMLPVCTCMHFYNTRTLSAKMKIVGFHVILPPLKITFIYASSLPCRTQRDVPYVEKGNQMNPIQALTHSWSAPSVRRLPIVSALR